MATPKHVLHVVSSLDTSILMHFVIVWPDPFGLVGRDTESHHDTIIVRILTHLLTATPAGIVCKPGKCNPDKEWWLHPDKGCECMQGTCECYPGMPYSSWPCWSSANCLWQQARVDNQVQINVERAALLYIICSILASTVLVSD